MTSARRARRRSPLQIVKAQCAIHRNRMVAELNLSPPVERAARKLIHTVARRCEEHDVAIISFPDMAARLGVSTKTIQRAARALEDADLVERVSIGHRGHAPEFRLGISALSAIELGDPIG